MKPRLYRFMGKWVCMGSTVIMGVTRRKCGVSDDPKEAFDQCAAGRWVDLG